MSNPSKLLAVLLCLRARARLAARLSLGAVVLLTLALGAGRARAQAPFDLTRPPNGDALGLHQAVLPDPTGRLDIQQVSAPTFSQRFVPATSRAPGLGFTRDAHWVRLNVENRGPAARAWLLELAYPNLDFVDLYVPRPDGGFERRSTGDQRPFAQRDIAHRTFVFRLSEPPGTHRTYYLRVQTEGTLNLPLVAWTEESLRQHLNVEQPLMWMFYGLILVMAVYNLFVFVSVRQREYLYYCLYVLSFMLFQATLNGHFLQYASPTWPWLANRAAPFFLGTTLFFALRFIVHFLSLRKVLPWAYHCVFWGGNLSALLAVYGVFGSYSASVRAQVMLGLPVNWVMLVATVILVRRRFRPAQLYALAWSVFMVGVLLYYLRAAGLIPSNLVTEWAAQLGAAIEVVLLSLALADRINVLRRDLSQVNAQLSRNVEELRDALQQAQAATRAKGEFLATVSHELRTPLNAIINIPQALARDVPLIQLATCNACGAQFALDRDERVERDTPCPDCARAGSLQLAEQRAFTGRADHLAEQLGYIRRSGLHLLEIVNAILDFSKLGAAGIQLKPQLVDLGPLLHEVVEPLRQLAQASGVTLHLSDPPQDAALLADPLRLRQVLINLIGNAIKFSDGRGNVFVAVTREPHSYLFEVRDEGIGIAPEHLERVFRSFEQVEQGDTRRFGGTGLGLSIAKSLVDLHGGEIWVESEPGRGARFFVRMPAAGPASMPPPAPEPFLRASA